MRVPEEAGIDWQTRIPPESPTPQFDRAIVALVYRAHADLQAVAERLAAAESAQWTQLLERWDAIRQDQRQYILAHPGCIPPPRMDGWETLDLAAQDAAEAERCMAQRLERQVWLSRLLAARPRGLAMAEYARIRLASASLPPWGAERGRRSGGSTSHAGATSLSGALPALCRSSTPTLPNWIVRW